MSIKGITSKWSVSIFWFLQSLKITPIVFRCLLHIYLLSISKNFSLKTLFKIKIIALIRILFFFNILLTLFVFCKKEMFSLFHIKCFTATLMFFILYWKKYHLFFMYIWLPLLFINKSVPGFLVILLGSKKAVC